MNLKLINLTSFFITLAVIFSTGCTPVALNTGATDYARANKNCISLDPGDRYETLQKKYGETNEVDSLIVKKGESISVTLQHVFIKDFSERLERLTSKISGDAVRGEIAILAKVYEQTDDTHIDFTQAGTKRTGRLIYYSEDVRSGGHPLNFSQLPIYGPIEYKGNSLVIQFTILELDIAESNQIKGMLGTLSKLGQSAYPPASPILQVLESVGSNLLSGNQDDLEFSYSFTLHPNTGHEKVKDAKLMAGNYVLVKEEPSLSIGESFPKTNWDNLRFDSDEGRLKKKSNTTEWVNFTDKTYIVVQINTGLPSVGLDVAQTFSELETELSGNVDKTEFNKKLIAAADNFKAYATDQNNKEKIAILFARSMALLKDYTEKTDPKEKKYALAGFYDITVSEMGFPPKPDFNENQWARIIQKLRSIAVDPYKISKTSVTSAANYAALERLLLQ